MPWFNVDDGFAFHHKAVKAGNAAIGLWTRAGSWCAQQLTNGEVPEHMVSVLGTPAQAKRLVDAGLWVKTETGYRFHEWLGRNPTKEEVLEKRRKDADKKAAARAAKAQKSASSQLETVDPQGTLPGFPEGLPKGVGSTTPLHSNKTKDSLRSSLRAVDEVNAGSIIAAWVEAYEPASGLKAKPTMKGQVGREAKSLLDAGADPGLVLAAAEAVGAKAMATLEREYAPMAARARRSAAQPTGELNPDDVLGQDVWTVPTPPPEIRDGPHEGLMRWDQEKRAERHQERLEEARRVLARRAA